MSFVYSVKIGVSTLQAFAIPALGNKALVASASYREHLGREIRAQDSDVVLGAEQEWEPERD